jgi:hypothetical protein
MTGLENQMQLYVDPVGHNGEQAECLKSISLEIKVNQSHYRP